MWPCVVDRSSTSRISCPPSIFRLPHSSSFSSLLLARHFSPSSLCSSPLATSSSDIKVNPPDRRFPHPDPHLAPQDVNGHNSEYVEQPLPVPCFHLPSPFATAYASASGTLAVSSKIFSHPSPHCSYAASFTSSPQHALQSVPADRASASPAALHHHHPPTLSWNQTTPSPTIPFPASPTRPLSNPPPPAGATTPTPIPVLKPPSPSPC